MTSKLTTQVALLYALMSAAAYAHTGFQGTLASGTTTDIILFQCSSQPGITVAEAYVRDEVPVNGANTDMKVYIATAPTSSTCPSKTDGAWTSVSASSATTGEGTWSVTPAGQLGIATSGWYCVKVTKAAGTAADDYQLNHHCATSQGAAHQASSSGVYKLNE